jgi:branched-chain amino acid transport system substrate-binding protein
MRRTIPRSARLAILLTALMLAAVACSIQAPDVILSGGSGTGNGGTTTGPGGTTTGPGGTVTGPGGTVTGPGGTTTGPGGAAATDTSCAGKPTFTGVTGTDIKLGGTFALSGPVSNISGPILKGVQAYFNETNRQGIFGRKITLVVKDDGWDAQKGKALIKQLVEQDKVFFLTVVPSSNGLDASRSYLEQKKVPVFGTSGLIESQFRSPMQWPVGTSTRSAARIGLLDMKARGAKNTAVIWLDLLAGLEAFEAIKESAPAIFGVKSWEDFITGHRQVSLSEASFGTVWASIKSQTQDWQRRHGQEPTGIPDFVTFAIDPTNADKALKAAQDIGFRPKVGWGGGAPLFLSVVAANEWARATGLLAGTSYFPPLAEFNSNAAVQQYRQTLTRYYGSGIDPLNPYLEGGYAGAALTVDILKRAGSCLTRDAVIAAANSLTAYSAAGLTQPMNFTAKSHYGNTSGLIVQVQSNGTWKVTRDWLKDPSPGE